MATICYACVSLPLPPHAHTPPSNRSSSLLDHDLPYSLMCLPADNPYPLHRPRRRGEEIWPGKSRPREAAWYEREDHRPSSWPVREGHRVCIFPLVLVHLSFLARCCRVEAVLLDGLCWLPSSSGGCVLISYGAYVGRMSLISSRTRKTETQRFPAWGLGGLGTARVENGSSGLACFWGIGLGG